jgi:hypothetical protein
MWRGGGRKKNENEKKKSGSDPNPKIVETPTEHE